MDNCAFNRPFDDQNQLKIKLDEGMRVLLNNLGAVEAERFISLIIREPFDYTEWQRGLFNDMSVKELSRLAMEEWQKTVPVTTQFV